MYTTEESKRLLMHRGFEREAGESLAKCDLNYCTLEGEAETHAGSNSIV